MMICSQYLEFDIDIHIEFSFNSLYLLYLMLINTNASLPDETCCNPLYCKLIVTELIPFAILFAYVLTGEQSSPSVYVLFLGANTSP